MQCDETAVVTREAERARELGFGGKLCVHPAQVGTVNRAFAPSPGDLDWARRVLATASTRDGALSVDGRMIDRPLLERAQRLLDRAERT